MGLAYRFRGSVYYPEVQSRQDHGILEAGMVQEDLTVLHLHLKGGSRVLASRKLG